MGSRICERAGRGGKEVYTYTEHCSARGKINPVSKSIQVAILTGHVWITSVTAQIEKGHAC